MGHLECVRELIIWGAEIETMDQDGRTALSVAVTCDSESAAKLVTLLLDNGANPNKADRDSMTPLLIAAFEGKPEFVRSSLRMVRMWITRTRREKRLFSQQRAWVTSTS